MTKNKKGKADSKKRREQIKSYLQIKGNIIFLVLNVVSALIIAGSVILSIFDRKYTWVCWDSNSIGVLSQVITAVVAFIISTIGIAITLQKEECWGVSVREFNNLRVSLRFSITMTIVTAVLLSAFNVAFYIMNFIIATIGMSIVAITFCIYVVVSEIPLMLKNEKYMFNTVKHSLLSKWKKNSDLPKELKEVLKYLLINKTLVDTYGNLKTSDNQYNRSLVLKLLELLNDSATELSKIESKEIQLKRADSLLVSMKNLVFFSFDLFKILGEDASTYYYYVNYVLFKLKDVPEFKEKVTSLVASILSNLKYVATTEEKIQFNMRIVLAMVTITVREGDLDFVKKLQQDFSIGYYRLGHDNYESIVFALVSMQMYFLCHDSQNAPQELKSAIKNFISLNYTVDHTDVSSWKNLYGFFSREFKLDFAKFMYYFDVSEGSWDVPKYHKMQFVTLDQQYATNWFLTHVLNSYRTRDFDYSTLCLNDYCRYSLKEIGTKCFVGEQSFVITDEMKSILDFYGVDNGFIRLFAEMDEYKHRLFEFINGIKKVDLLEGSSSSTNNEEIAERYRQEILTAIHEEWGYDASIQITSEVKSTAVMIEKSSRAINYEEVMSNSLIYAIFNDMKNSALKTATKVTSEVELEKALSDKFAYVNEARRYLRYSLKDESLIKKLDDACGQAEEFKSRILNGDVLVKEKGFSFNVELTELSVRSLSAQEVSEEVETYKRADGQYVCDGVFLSREEIEGHIKNKYGMLNMSIRYQIETYGGAIVVIDINR